MIKISKEKFAKLENLSTDSHVISALAIDQRGSLKKMLAAGGASSDIEKDIVDFKVAISEELTPFASSILLDPEYGIPASKQRAKDAGLLVAYEKTGYDASEPGRLPDLLSVWSARRIKELGADAVKFLLYYDVDEDAAINDQKHAFVERLGSECLAEDIPLFVELVSYDANSDDVKGPEFAKVKPNKVIGAMKEFSNPKYHIDVLKVEVPINMNYVEGFTSGEVVYTREEALGFLKEQSEATELPFIFLSAGVSAKLFRDTLELAHEAGSRFNGVLCGRATWKDSVAEYATKGGQACRDWLKSQGKTNIDELNEVLSRTAVSWTERIEAE